MNVIKYLKMMAISLVISINWIEVSVAQNLITSERWVYLADTVMGGVSEGSANIIDTPEEHNYLLRTKTLGSQNGLFENLLPIWYSGNAPLGNLLKAKLENDPKFTVNPGERKEIPYKIKSPLFINPRTLWVSIETFGEMVTLNGVVMEEYTATGSAIDLIESENSLDLYLIISPSNVSNTFINKGCSALSSFFFSGFSSLFS